VAPKVKTADRIYFSKDHQMVRKAVAEFVKKEINPYVDQWEEDEIAPLKDIFRKMGDLGFLGIRYDPKYGGQGLDYWYDLVFLEELGHIKALGLAVAITVQTHMATPAIAEFGSEFLKETYLKAAISGDMVVVANRWEDSAATGIGGDQTSIYVVMSRTFQSGQMQPWLDLTPRVRELADGQPLIIERVLTGESPA